MEQRTHNRWFIALAAAVLQVALGAVYAWSVFRQPLVSAFGWTISEVTLTFTLTILTLGFAAFAGGLWMARVGPCVTAVTGGALYGLGVLLAGFSADRLWLLYLTYGLLGGLGLGLAYIVPVAVLVKWFPDKRGMATGIAVAGFGAGALVTAPVATRLIDTVGVMRTFTILGAVYLVISVGAALLMRDPPAGYCPAGWEGCEEHEEREASGYTIREALGTWQWYALWGLLFLNVSAGIAIISQAAPMAEEITGVDAYTAAGLVGIISIANAAGRFLWAWLSDFIGRRVVFLIMFLLQAGIFLVLPQIHTFVLFAVLAFLVLLCYGGGFGTMPAFTADYFGPRHVGSIYGLILTAWGFGGAFGPLLTAYAREHTGRYDLALYVLAGVMLVAAAIPMALRPPTPQEAREQGQVPLRRRPV